MVHDHHQVKRNYPQRRDGSNGSKGSEGSDGHSLPHLSETREAADINPECLLAHVIP